MFSLRNVTKVHVSLVVTIVLMSAFAGALIQTKQVSASTVATWDPSLGWDFESHSNTHPYFTSLTVSQMKAELNAVNAAFAAHGYPPPQHFAYPYGDYNDAVEQVVSAYYKSARTVSDNMTTFPVPNWYELNAAQLVSTTVWSDVTGWISQCIAQKGLLVIFSHDVSANPSEYGCTPQMLKIGRAHV
jgi:peptidoglycan/xylan/chitin deacetylase (PgdA/CDA1 family)